jgi:allophanate hydrolase subunit 2
MIRISKAAVATSIQDQGRFGHRSRGNSRSGAMDPLSLRVANTAAGAPESAAGVELGPGPCKFECLESVIVAFGGGVRDGCTWWEPVELRKGQQVELSPPREGVWSYLAISGGVDAPMVMDSRSTQVREGIGRWLGAGDFISAGRENTPPSPITPPPMGGPIRIDGSLPGDWHVGTRLDRMGYELTGSKLPAGKAGEWSEPLLPGCVQILPSGTPFVLMVEDPIAGGYEVTAVVHSDDLRLVAQTPAGKRVHFIEAGS